MSHHAVQIERTIGKNLKGMRASTADELLAVLGTNKLVVNELNVLLLFLYAVIETICSDVHQPHYF